MKSHLRQLDVIEELIAAGKIREAQGQLDKIDTDSVPENERGLYYLLGAEAAMHAGVYSPEAIEKAIVLLRYHPDTRLFARAKHVKGWYQAATGEFLAARATFMEAYVHFKRCEDELSAVIALNRVAYCQSQSGDLVGAGNTLVQCLEMANTLGDVRRVAVVAHNLGKIRRMNGCLREAQRIYAKYAVTPTPGNAESYIYYCCVASIPVALLGRIDEARRIIIQAKPYVDQYARENAVYHENLGLIEFLGGDFRTAEQTLLAGLEIALKVAARSSLVSQNKRLLADVYIASKEWGQAEVYATEALQIAEQIGERPEVAASRRALAQIHHNWGRRKEARTSFQQALDAFEQMEFRYDLAVTRYLAAISGLWTRRECAALLYLAREYFVSEGIDHFVAAVDGAFRSRPLPTAPDEDSGGCGVPAVIGRSDKMRRSVEAAKQAAATELTVLLTGETGTGKDLLARYIHYHSGRQGRFVSVNSAAIPGEIIESELFGYARGAFTGAAENRQGLIEEANDGTLYLNEIADSSPAFQAKLLEVFETRQVRRLGQNKLRNITCRLIAATNHDLQELIARKEFRQDLFHRLNQVPIHLPPLRERAEDISLLIEHFLVERGVDVKEHAEVIERLSLLWSLRQWPGNVRQLQTELAHLLVQAQRDLSRLIDLALASEPEGEQLRTVLTATAWNRRQAARVLGVSEGAIRKRIQKHGLSKN
ncbi:MAG TPA: sigma 54-interacting transcriptional regulator [candidate division Zixibacteria bacterium]|nr:sigma 54-interacting transcriptional regulator [candidate division Zixibacteria bacterium]MDD4918005.1 sigma 54-interacting transcriptional regulator [candidate division Zixibacteria bacterium]MDM7972443.1 sigma 54-interacting transcriptional regulator [candidate division Zixibacteria bacterium]HOZ07101.1 sigma 54-interacting transcriptional regulator [candidate division Zixibacteria bacterium]HPM38244.1 sigma 54-interacting transcriptional regulator [candidate division Zixibacteria bacteriu